MNPPFAPASSPAGPGPPGPVLLVVEGIHDIEFLLRISRTLHAHDSRLPDLVQWEQENRVVFVPTGGSNLLAWADRLVPLGRPAFFLLDRDVPPWTAERRRIAAALNQRPGWVAWVTNRRSVENYLAPRAIRDACGIEIAIDDDTDVATDLARRVLTTTAGPDWERLSRRARQRLRNRIKRMLHTHAVAGMSFDILDQHDPAGEVVGWLQTIAALAQGESP